MPASDTRYYWAIVETIEHFSISYWTFYWKSFTGASVSQKDTLSQNLKWKQHDDVFFTVHVKSVSEQGVGGRETGPKLSMRETKREDACKRIVKDPRCHEMTLERSSSDYLHHSVGDSCTKLAEKEHFAKKVGKCSGQRACFENLEKTVGDLMIPQLQSDFC